MQRSERVFIKHFAPGEFDRLDAEVDGLEQLRAAGAIAVVEVLSVAEGQLRLRRIEPCSHPDWLNAGRSMAALHSHHSSTFGYYRDNYCGDTVQVNSPLADGYAFYAEHRLGYQARLAFDRGLLDQRDVAAVERVATKLNNLIPQQPASLLHGDLWSGNMLFNRENQAVLIDPAVYYGWAEAELAMTALFGGFPAEFYSAYTEVNALPAGYKSRFDLYNLYHLLNHLNLFGSSYYPRVRSTIERYA